MKPSSVERLLAIDFISTCVTSSVAALRSSRPTILLARGGGESSRIVLDTPPAHGALGTSMRPNALRISWTRASSIFCSARAAFGCRRTLVLKVLSRLTGREMLDELIDFLSLSGDVLEFMGDRGRQVMALQRRELTQYVLVTAGSRGRGSGEAVGWIAGNSAT